MRASSIVGMVGRGNRGGASGGGTAFASMFALIAVIVVIGVWQGQSIRNSEVTKRETVSAFVEHIGGQGDKYRVTLQTGKTIIYRSRFNHKLPSGNIEVEVITKKRGWHVMFGSQELDWGGF